MNTFKCEICNNKFKSKQGYENHKSKKIPCDDNEKKNYLIKARTCSICFKTFQRPNLLEKHQIKCKNKNAKDTQMIQNNNIKEVKRAQNYHY